MLVQQEPDFVEEPDFIDSPTMNQIPQPEDLEDLDLEEEKSEDEPIYQDRVNIPAPAKPESNGDSYTLEDFSRLQFEDKISEIIRFEDQLGLIYKGVDHDKLRIEYDQCTNKDLRRQYQTDIEIQAERNNLNGNGQKP